MDNKSYENNNNKEYYNVNKEYINNRNFDHSQDAVKKDLAFLMNIFYMFFGLILIVVAFLGVYLFNDYKKVQAEKAQELKKMEGIIEQARKRKEEAKRIEKEKIAKERKQKELEKRKQLEEEFNKKREEGKKQLELARKELSDFYVNIMKKYKKENFSISEEKLIEDYNSFLSILKKYDSIRVMPGFYYNYNYIIYFYVRKALDEDYSKLLEEMMNNKNFSPKNWKFNYMPTVFYLAEKDSRKCLDLIIDDCDLKEELVSEKDKKIYEKDDKYKIEEGLTLLHLAAKRGNLTLAKKVLEAGVSVNKKTKEGITPIDYAIKNNQLEMVKFLIENKAEVNPETISLASDSAMIKILRQTR